MQNRPDIGGLRAIAVLSVIVFHMHLGATERFVGVDIFFVISGYLVTKVIFQEIQANLFSHINYYGRRACRILPALFIVTGVSITLEWANLFPEDYENFPQNVASMLSASLTQI